VVHVIAGDTGLPGDRQSADGLRQLTADLGARWHEIQDDEPARAIISFAREHQITQIVIGSIQNSWWHITDGGPVIRHVIHEAGASGIDVLIIARRETSPSEAVECSAAKQPCPGASPVSPPTRLPPAAPAMARRVPDHRPQNHQSQSGKAPSAGVRRKLPDRPDVLEPRARRARLAGNRPLAGWLPVPPTLSAIVKACAASLP
jgi:hypothetical protein